MYTGCLALCCMLLSLLKSATKDFFSVLVVLLYNFIVCVLLAFPVSSRCTHVQYGFLLHYYIVRAIIYHS